VISQSQKTHDLDLQELVRADWLYLMCGFFWRSMCITAAAAVCAAVLGFMTGLVVGIIMKLAGIPQESYMLPFQVICVLLGMGIGFASLAPYIKWLMRARFGSLRLKLERTEESVAIASHNG
jgi:ABC-type Fe3+ transport system permease subunit